MGEGVRLPGPEDENKGVKGQKQQNDALASSGRRRFLKTLGVAAVATPFIETGARVASAGQEYPLDVAGQEKSITNLETANAHYKILYTRHDYVASPALMDGADALILEGAGIAPREEGLTAPFKMDESHRDNLELAKKAIGMRKPFFLTDFVGTNIDHLSREIKKTGRIGDIETLIGGVLLYKSPDIATSRRGFIAGSAAAVGGAYLASRAPQKIADLATTRMHTTGPDEKSISRKIEKGLGGVNTAIHPETYSTVIETRNTLIAQKTEAVAHMLRKELGRKPVIAICIGAAHFGLEAELMSSEKERIIKLRRDFGTDFAQQAILVRIDVADPNDQGREVLRGRVLKDPAFSE